jgi:positive regulator of sigma E activity
MTIARLTIFLILFLTAILFKYDKLTKEYVAGGIIVIIVLALIIVFDYMKKKKR